MGPEDNVLSPAAPLPADPSDVARAARERCGLVTGERVLVAVSGGADSVALASLLAAAAERGLALDLVLAHLDHGWRGPAEAAADRAVVQALAARLGRPLLLAGPPEPPARTESAARRWRYATLARMAREAGAVAVAVGHHLRDQAETVLLRLLAGSQAYGLSGMAPRRSLDGGRLAVVRPLLEVHPAALRAWNERQGLTWREDPTNAGPGARNEVRRRLLALEARRRDPVAALAEVAARARARVERRKERVWALLRAGRRVQVPGAGVAVERPSLKGLEGDDLAAALRLLGGWLAADAAGPWLKRRHVEAAARAIEHGGAVDLPRGLTLRVTRARVWLLRRSGGGPGYRLAQRTIPRQQFDLEAYRREAHVLIAALDAERLGPAPRLRAAQAGDQFVPLGRAGTHAVEVAAWMRRRGIPRLARRGALVVEGTHGIAWVPGLREDAAHAVAADTRRVAILELEPGA